LSHPQLAEIEALLLSVIRKAYDLGRSDALKKVVAAVNGDRSLSEPLALMAPASASPPRADEARSESEHSVHLWAYQSAAESMRNGVHRSPETPWWAYPVR
jgi:hypothetical protein